MKQTTTIRQLMRKYDLGRVEVENALGDLPFEVGSNNTHLFDKAAAEKLVAAVAKTVTELKQLRLRKLQAEVDLVRQKSDDYNKNHIRVEDALGLLDGLNKNFWGAVRSSGFLSYPQECSLENMVERACLDSMRDAGISEAVIGPRRQALRVKEKQFIADMKSGKIPETWAETFTPMNARRVWCQHSGRYLTKREIIARFGPSSQISPIDEVLAEVAELESEEA